MIKFFAKRYYFVQIIHFLNNVLEVKKSIDKLCNNITLSKNYQDLY